MSAAAASQRPLSAASLASHCAFTSIASEACVGAAAPIAAPIAGGIASCMPSIGCAGCGIAMPGGMPGGMPDMGGMPGGAPGGDDAGADEGPKIEEID